MNLFTKEKQTHRHRKQAYGYQRGRRWEGINSELWVSRYTLLLKKQINNKVLQRSTGNYIHYLVITYNEKESERDDIYTHIHVHWRRKWQPTPVFLPGEAHGRRSLVGYSPRGRKESDTTERLHFHFHTYTHTYM